MQSLKLAHIHGCDIIRRVGNEVGFGGADGQVFDLIDSSHQVIKLSILYEYSNSLECEFDRISKVLTYLQSAHPSVCARVFEHQKLVMSSRQTISELQKYLLYYYIMEKCRKISDDEKRVFHTILSHEDREIKKNFSNEKVKNILNGLSMGLEFDVEKVMMFYTNVNKIPIQHTDIHPRNIMKNINGDFKLIDFDRCCLR